MIFRETPRQLGYRFPAEWETQAATWFSWPHKEDSWPERFAPIPAVFTEIVKILAGFQHVNINVVDRHMHDDVMTRLIKAGVDSGRFSLFPIPTNDAWCRDHGPAFVVNPEAEEPLAIIDWDYNAWGGKYPPYDLDDMVPTRIAEYRQVPLFYPGIIMEGGAIDVNGAGCLLTSAPCLLNPNRNPHLSQSQVEWYLREYYNVEKILWVEEGIAGDDTDGHIDDSARFVSADTIVAVVEDNRKDENYLPLQKNLRQLKKMTDPSGRLFRIVELPMPRLLEFDGQRVPASYANFLIANGVVLVPTFRDRNDDFALSVLQDLFPARRVIGIDCYDLVWGLGTLHCISQQEPLVKVEKVS
ncbi:MAG: agmatine deiminase family protein [Syntrophales bacterium]|jgi:agmatine deiminase|nr:agmatine deiminase family protein [Syntrophales bacterium]